MLRYFCSCLVLAGFLTTLTAGCGDSGEKTQKPKVKPVPEKKEGPQDQKRSKME